MYYWVRRVTKYEQSYYLYSHDCKTLIAIYSICGDKQSMATEGKYGVCSVDLEDLFVRPEAPTEHESALWKIEFNIPYWTEYRDKMDSK